MIQLLTSKTHSSTNMMTRTPRWMRLETTSQLNRFWISTQTKDCLIKLASLSLHQ